MPKHLTPKAASEWGPVLTLYLGMAVLIFCAVFWAFTNRLEPYLLATAGGLLGTSQGLDAIAGLKQPPPSPPPPLPDTTVGVPPPLEENP